MSGNMFGGKNQNSLYVPMSETEQEVLSRLVETQDLVVEVKGWGIVHNPAITFGDLRVCVAFRMDFKRPEAPVPVHFFDLVLKTRAGIILFAQRQSSMYGGKPIQIAAGVFLDLRWDIAIHHLNPKLVKMVKPSAKGLTSRVLDKDTGNVTLTGNMVLTQKQKRTLAMVRSAEARGRQDTVQQAQKATDKEKELVKQGTLKLIG